MRVERCKYAVELLHEIGLNGTRYGGTAEKQLLFRGYAASPDFGLTPRVLRDGRPAATVRAQVQAEVDLLREFVIAANQQGLWVPGGYTATEQKVRKPYFGVMFWPPSDVHPLLALAQHYGVPTRLLDWSYSPRVAAYFAARSYFLALENKIKQPISHLAVAVLDTGRPAWRSCQSVSELGNGAPYVLQVVEVDRHGIPNLLAQHGVFTCTKVLDSHGREPAPPRLDEAFEALWSCDPFVTEPQRYGDPKDDVFVEFTLPVEQAGELLRLLHREGVSGTTMFPGYEGAAQVVREKEWLKGPPAT